MKNALPLQIHREEHRATRSFPSLKTACFGTSPQCRFPSPLWSMTGKSYENITEQYSRSLQHSQFPLAVFLSCTHPCVTLISSIMYAPWCSRLVEKWKTHGTLIQSPPTIRQLRKPPRKASGITNRKTDPSVIRLPAKTEHLCVSVFAIALQDNPPNTHSLTQFCSQLLGNSLVCG